MPVRFEVTDRAAHNALPVRKKAAQRDPEWEAAMDQIETGQAAVTLPFADEKERGTLARSVGRRAAHRGFKVDIKYGEGFISVVRAAEETKPARRRRTQRVESDAEGQ